MARINRKLPWFAPLFGLIAGFALAADANAQNKTPSKYETVTKGYTKVVSTADGKSGLFTIWVDKKNGKMLAEIPTGKKKYFMALTVASGEKYAGLQAGEMYVYWEQYGDRIALLEPNVDTRSTGDLESKKSVQRLFTDRVVTDAMILAKAPNGALVIDMDDLLVKQATKFFGFRVPGQDMALMMRLRKIKTAKAFPKNVELAFEIPMEGGRLKSLHYSISEIPDKTGYDARQADDRVGYFTTAYNDLGKYKRDETRIRYINRWHLEKADPKIKLSPPKNPIIFYIEHTTPIRYRRFVRDGILAWNKAFEKIGLVNAIEVYYQDAATGAHMEKDPEDVRYNFVRWLNNNIGTAIGPSRVHPLTGQILDADIILTDGWIRHFEHQFSELLPQFAMEGFSPETLAWLERHPRWDPRFLMMPGHQRNMWLAQRMRQGAQPLGGHPLANVKSKMLGDDEFDGLVGRTSQVNGMCTAAWGKAFDLAMLRMTHEMALAQMADGANKDEDMLDGIPSRFIGPLLADLVAHEVGHTLGLRHNFKASSLYSLKEINSDKIRGKKPFATSVMDYLPLNINMKDGKLQGDYAMIDIGPYDFWAIEYGYSFEKDLKPILAKCVLPEHDYGTDQDTLGPDPFARRYDFTSNPIDFAKNQMKVTKFHRDNMFSKFIKDGDSWSKARRGYELTLSMQTRSLSMIANWVGGAHVYRNHKGDKTKRSPIEPVSYEKQKQALQWVIDNSFFDESFSLSPKLLRRMKYDHYKSDESFAGFRDPTFPIHDRVMGIQGSVLTMLLNPSTLRQVYDNELMAEDNEEVLTLPELMDTVTGAIWKELDNTAKKQFTVRNPMISSLRRNLQREQIERLIDLAKPSGFSSAAMKPISTLAMMHLRDVNAKLEKALKRGMKLDAYSRAHLQDSQIRITKALESQYIFNANEIGGGGFSIPFFFNNGQHQCGCAQCQQPTTPQSWNERK